MMRRLALLAVLALAGCKAEKPVADYSVQPADMSPAIGGRLTQALLGDPQNLVPFLAADTVAGEIGGLLYQSLIRYDKNLSLQPELATWEVLNAGKTIVFRLAPGVAFSDGSPLTSADVMATYKVMIDPKTRTPYAADYNLVKRAETPDPLTFVVHYDKAFVPALSSWAGLPILPKKIIDQTPDFNETPLRDQPQGSGSYTLKSWQRGSTMLLVRNPSSTQSPRIAEMLYRQIPDQDTQFMELKQGGLDIAGIKPLAYERLTDAPWFTRQYSKLRYLSNSYVYLGFNLKNPLFTDVRVRQALSYATDRQGIINAVLFGQGLPMAGIFKPGTWPYNSKLEPYPYNPVQARHLLAAAGWTDTDGDGVLDKDGKPFAFTVFTNQGNEARFKTAQVMQKLFADVGVKMEIRVQEWSTFLTNTLEPKAFDAILMGWALGAEPDPYDIWHSSKTGPKEFNMISYANRRVDTLAEQAREAFDQRMRKAMLDEIQEILHAEQPYLWIYAPYALVAVHKRVQGISPTAAGIGYNQPEWFIPRAWQNKAALEQ